MLNISIETDANFSGFFEISKEQHLKIFITLQISLLSLLIGS